MSAFTPNGFDPDRARYCTVDSAWENRGVCTFCGDTIWTNHDWAHAFYACLYHPDARPAPGDHSGDNPVWAIGAGKE